MARRLGSHAETTGPRVRAAALTLIAKHGFAAVSMRQIAAAVDLQAGALYSYTPDKAALLADLIKRHLADRQTAWDAIPKPDGHVEWLESFTRFHLGQLRAAPEASALLRLELRNLAAEPLAEVEEINAVYEAQLISTLSEGGKVKVFAVPEPRLAAVAVLHLLDGVASYGASDTAIEPERAERIAWNMVRRAVGAKGFQ